MIKPSFSDFCGIAHPLVMAPMFLVSNAAMIKAGMDAGIMAVFPSLNFRADNELEAVLGDLNNHLLSTPGSFGVNLIVQATNPLYRKHLRICADHKVPYYITSLGNPSAVIEIAHSYGGKVMCDVTNLAHAAKCHAAGCDGFLAVGAGAGGHAGPNALHVLVTALKEAYPDKYVVAAGGISTGGQIAGMLVMGADAVSIGTRYIASSEAAVSDTYKNAIISAGMDDIVMTEKLSGTPCAIIDTPFARKIGYRQNWLEKKLNKNRRLKKYFKMLVQWRGMKMLENSVRPGNYNNLWSAGQSVQHISEVLPVKAITDRLLREMDEALLPFRSGK